MTAPVIGFNAEVDRGINGETYVQIEPTDDGTAIEITITGTAGEADDFRAMLVSHDEARQIIAGLASVIT